MTPAPRASELCKTCSRPFERYSRPVHKMNLVSSRPKRCLVRAEAEERKDRGEKQDSCHSNLPAQIKQLLNDDPETQDRLERVRKAAAVMAALQVQKEELNQEITAANYASAWERQNQERQQAQRAAERGADADILRAADQLEKAQAELTAALSEQTTWSLAVNEDAERIQSAKAAAVGAVGAVLGGLPLAATANAPPLVSAGSLGVLLVTGLLFGVTYRYAVRRDVANVQLKGGVVAAFGLVRGLAQAEEILRRSAAGSPTVPLEVLGGAAIAAGESMLVIGFAAAAMELAFRKGFVRTFGGDA